MSGMFGKTRATWLLVALVCACSGEPGGADPSAIKDVPSALDPGTGVALTTPEGARTLALQVDDARQATADELRTSHALSFGTELGYDPLAAANLGQILEKTVPLLLQEATKARLTQAGFALQARGQTPSFASGYAEIYQADLPVFVSTDMVLEAVYRSHDKILQAVEKTSLEPRLDDLLTSIRTALLAQAGSLEPEVASDLNFYLGVALSLLHGKADARESSAVKSFVDAAVTAAGEQERIVFGVNRRIDFSQFKPRGHYDGDEGLERYFRAMIWLGRLDFRLIETEEDGTQTLRRRQVQSVIALRKLLDARAFARYLSIDNAVSAFVGEHDYMTLQEVDELLTSLATPDGSIAEVADDELANAIVAGEFGAQRIASQVMRRQGGGGATLPLSMSFALFGQRYTVDSHVFSNVVYDRVPTRVVPSPLDVAFAALGNDRALGLLGRELDDQAGYPGQLSAIRSLVDAHPQAYWESSLYTNWLSALRTLSPAATPPSDLPTVARTEGWARRLLNTQLSSWAELRHNNVLYVKQSYTSGAACEYPEAYIDPYPEFFRSMVRFAERAQELLAGLELSGELGGQVQDYFARVARINATLAEMATAQRSGQPHSAEDMAFINRAVTTSVNCDGTVLGHTGWYSELHFDPLQAVEMDPAITDVHTDVGGDLPVSRQPSVLHVGTGLPRMMIVSVDSCNGPRAYAGFVSSYHEVLEDGLDRLTDDEWKQRLLGGNEPDVPWLTPILAE
jgi:hypothetical protein